MEFLDSKNKKKKKSYPDKIITQNRSQSVQLRPDLTSIKQNIIK